MKIFKSINGLNNKFNIIEKQSKELNNIGVFSDYFNDKMVSLFLEMTYCYKYNNGYNNLKDFLKIVKNNKSFNEEIKNISINDIIDDNNDNSISIKCKNKLIKIDFKNKSITTSNAIYHYSQDFIINNRKPIINKVNNLIDMNDSATNNIINSSWSKKDRELFKNKIKSIISNLPKKYNINDFANMKFFTNNGTKATYDDFTLINSKGIKLHCVRNKQTNKHNCYII